MCYNKRKCFNNFPRIGLGYKHGGRAIVLEQQYGCRAWFSLATHSQARAQRSKFFLFLVFAYVLAFMLAFALQQVKRIPLSLLFLSAEAALLLVSPKNRDLWDGPTPEVHDSRTFRNSVHVQSQVWQSDWLRIRNKFSALAPKIDPFHRSWFLVLTKRSAASGDENALRHNTSTRIFTTRGY